MPNTRALDLLIRIRIQRFFSMQIWIQLLFYLMRIQIQLKYL